MAVVLKGPASLSACSASYRFVNCRLLKHTTPLQMGLGPQGCVSVVPSLVAVDSVSIDCTAKRSLWSQAC